MVNIQRKDYGGGEIRFDGKVIRKDGVFLPKSLAKLNGWAAAASPGARAAGSPKHLTAPLPISPPPKSSACPP